MVVPENDCKLYSLRKLCFSAAPRLEKTHYQPQSGREAEFTQRVIATDLPVVKPFPSLIRGKWGQLY